MRTYQYKFNVGPWGAGVKSTVRAVPVEPTRYTRSAGYALMVENTHIATVRKSERSWSQGPRDSRIATRQGSTPCWRLTCDVDDSYSTLTYDSLGEAAAAALKKWHIHALKQKDVHVWKDY